MAPNLWALANMGRAGMNFIRAPLFIKPSKTRFALRAFVAFIDPARIVVGPKGNRRRRIGGRMFGAVLWRRLNMCVGPSGAFNQRGGVIMAVLASFIFSQ